MKRPLKLFLKSILIAAAILFPATIMTVHILKTESIRCTVCMKFRGNENCRTAEGPDREQCIRTATNNACALLASGMSDSLACEGTKPISVTVED